MASSSATAKNFKGVRLRKWGRWGAEIRIPKSSQKIWLGAFSSAQEAARAYDAALYCLRGPHSHFNFPDSPPTIDSIPDSRDAIIKISRSYATQFQPENNDSNVSCAGAESKSSSLALDYCYCADHKKSAAATVAATATASAADDEELSLCCETCSLSLVGTACVNHHLLWNPSWPEVQQEEDLLPVVGEPDSFQNIWGFAEF